LASQNLLVLLNGKEKIAVLEKLEAAANKSDDFYEQEMSFVSRFPAKALLEHEKLTIHFCD